jgi:secretion/DNA translocation related TadE-like protein
VTAGRRRSQPVIRSERGGMTILAVAAIAVVVVLLTGALAVASAVHASHRARAAADLAALAAATRWQAGALPGEACSQASAVAVANGAELMACGPVADGSVTVEARVAARWPAVGAARVKARAGPGPLKECPTRTGAVCAP